MSSSTRFGLVALTLHWSENSVTGCQLTEPRNPTLVYTHPLSLSLITFGGLGGSTFSWWVVPPPAAGSFPSTIATTVAAPEGKSVRVITAKTAPFRNTVPQVPPFPKTLNHLLDMSRVNGDYSQVYTEVESKKNSEGRRMDGYCRLANE